MTITTLMFISSNESLASDYESVTLQLGTPIDVNFNVNVYLESSNPSITGEVSPGQMHIRALCENYPYEAGDIAFSVPGQAPSSSKITGTSYIHDMYGTFTATIGQPSSPGTYLLNSAYNGRIKGEQGMRLNVVGHATMSCTHGSLWITRFPNYAYDLAMGGEGMTPVVGKNGAAVRVWTGSMTPTQTTIEYARNVTLTPRDTHATLLRAKNMGTNVLMSVSPSTNLDGRVRILARGQETTFGTKIHFSKNEDVEIGIEHVNGVKGVLQGTVRIDVEVV